MSVYVITYIYVNSSLIWKKKQYYSNIVFIYYTLKNLVLMNPDQGNFFLFRILNFMADELFRDYCMIKIDMIEIIERKKKNHKKIPPQHLLVWNFSTWRENKLQ